MMKGRKVKRLLREGDYVAEVEVTWLEGEKEWSPTLSPSDIRKLDSVRLALRRGALQVAAKYARVYHLTPLAMN
jgi:hypothetical protein